MADIVISIVSKVAEYLVEPAIRRGQYFLCANKVIKDLENEKNELTTKRDDLQQRVEQAKERTEVIEKPVEKWLNDVKDILEEVVDLEQRVRENNNCFQGWCPTWRRYSLCKQMVKKIAAMAEFKGKSNFQPFSHRAPLPGITYLSSEKFTYFKSTKVAFNQVLEALQDDSIYMVGVYGMGGSGKTTLVTEVGKKAEELSLFDKVILVTVSQTPNIRGIQGKMADMLNLKLEEESEEGRAQRLWLGLKEKKRILVIVDDLWRKFHLENIGIRLDNNNKGTCKVLLTTRHHNVCTSMDCQKKIHLGLLSDDESWTLFQKHSSIGDDFSKSLHDVPQEVCKKCKGLPIAIVAMGCSLKEKSEAEWKKALHSLRHSETIDDHMEEGMGDLIRCFKFSYDSLKNKEAELLFLMCSMFPEDYEISIEDLIRYAIGLGLGDGFSLDIARSRITAGVNKLLDSCLLMHADREEEYVKMHADREEEYVKMHDVVRDVAIWIANNKLEGRKILVNLDRPLSSLAEDNSVRDYFAVSSWVQDRENQISLQWDAPNLEVLLLKIHSERSLDLSQSTFERIQGLKVLSLINVDRDRPSLALPPSTQLLTNLRTLRLYKYDLVDMSFLGSLVELEVLDLRECDFDELPIEIGNLKRLKLLDLSYCHIRRKTCNGAIGKCSQLEELYIQRLNSHDEPEELYVQIIVDIAPLPKLQRFEILVNFNNRLTSEHFSKRSVLQLENFDITNLKGSKKNILQTAEVVHLSGLLGGCKNIIPDMVGVVGGMDGLTSLIFQYGDEVECIIDTARNSQVDKLIPKLVELQLHRMNSLKELCRGPPLQVLPFFEKLKILRINGCPQLHSIFPWQCNLRNLKNLIIHNCTAVEVLFSMSVAQSLQQLEELDIEGCGELKHIIASGREHDSNANEEIAPALKNSHFVMPNLKRVTIRSCRKLESVFTICCVEGLAQLKYIFIASASKLKYVFGECDCKDHSSHHFENQIMLPSLEEIKVRDMENLVGICPENYLAKWPSLRKLQMFSCPKLTRWIPVMAGSKKVVQQKHMPSKLQELYLYDLPELTLISRVGPAPGQILSLQCLQHLHVITCQNLKSLFSIEVHRSLPELKSIHIEYCQELEQIIAENEKLVQLPNVEVYFPKLTDIKIKWCFKLKSLFSIAMVRMLPQLTTVDISEAAQLEEVFSHGGEEGTINEMEIMLPNLTKIYLKKLRNFVDICRGFKLKAEKLELLYIKDCRKSSRTLRAMQYFNNMGMPIVEGSCDKMEALLSQNINTADILLLLAASEGNKPRIIAYLEDGAKYDIKDADGLTALDRANNEIKDFILKFSERLCY